MASAYYVTQINRPARDIITVARCFRVYFIRGGSGGPAGTVWAGPFFTQLSINHYKLPSECAAILLSMHRSLSLSLMRSRDIFLLHTRIT